MGTRTWSNESTMKSYSRLHVLLVLICYRGSVAAAEPRTVAEKSEFKATSMHEEVVAFCRELAKHSKKVTLDELGVTKEGRKLPLLILADPPLATPQEAVATKKMIVFLLGNIHAGEVDGKEALLAWARDVALADKHPLLKDLIVLVAPIFNADGNDRIDPKNRPEQRGPIQGVGIRANAQGFDLNRDFVKLESPEVRSLIRLLNRWDPAVVIDMHTTNGSYHRYTLTYDGPRHPAADETVISYVREKLLPDAGKRLKSKTQFDSFFYGNFADKHTKWDSYPALPRFGLQYVGLRNRIALLSESYVYASYKDRIVASRGFVEGCLEHVAENHSKIRKLLADAAKPRDKVPLRIKTVSLGKSLTALGFVEETRDGKTVPTEQKKDYEVDLILRCEPVLSVDRPWAYLLPPEYRKAAEVLRLHGIAIDELAEEAKLSAEVYQVTKLTRAEREFQKHRIVALDVAGRNEMRIIPAGTLVIRTDQPLGTLASYLLEPQSEDGLAAWNFFDEALVLEKDYPVTRVGKKADIKMKKGPVRD
jgi:dipeptidyl-peptidase 4